MSHSTPQLCSLTSVSVCVRGKLCVGALYVLAYWRPKLTLGISFDQSPPVHWLNPDFTTSKEPCLHPQPWNYRQPSGSPGQHTCRISSLSTKPFPQPHNYTLSPADRCGTIVLMCKAAVSHQLFPTRCLSLSNA